MNKKILWWWWKGCWRLFPEKKKWKGLIIRIGSDEGKRQGSRWYQDNHLLKLIKEKRSGCFSWLYCLFVGRLVISWVPIDDDAKIGTVATATARRLSFGLRSHLLFFILFLRGLRPSILRHFSRLFICCFGFLFWAEPTPSRKLLRVLRHGR